LGLGWGWRGFRARDIGIAFLGSCVAARYVQFDELVPGRKRSRCRRCRFQERQPVLCTKKAGCAGKHRFHEFLPDRCRPVRPETRPPSNGPQCPFRGWIPKGANRCGLQYGSEPRSMPCAAASASLRQLGSSFPSITTVSNCGVQPTVQLLMKGRGRTGLGTDTTIGQSETVVYSEVCGTVIVVAGDFIDDERHVLRYHAPGTCVGAYWYLILPRVRSMILVTGAGSAETPGWQWSRPHQQVPGG